MRAKLKAIVITSAPTSGGDLPSNESGRTISSRRLRGVRWSAVVLGLLLSATASAANFVVTANPNLTFSPSSITINAGDTITFRNGGGFHNAVSDPGSVTPFSTGALSTAAWSVTV